LKAVKFFEIIFPMSYWGQSLGLVFNIPHRTIFVKKDDSLGSVEEKGVVANLVLAGTLVFEGKQQWVMVSRVLQGAWGEEKVQ
jgi:hypothetical protein